MSVFDQKHFPIIIFSSNFVIIKLGPDPDWIRIQQQAGSEFSKMSGSGFSKMPGSGFSIIPGSGLSKYESSTGTNYRVRCPGTTVRYRVSETVRYLKVLLSGGEVLPKHLLLQGPPLQPRVLHLNLLYKKIKIENS
jgi:hypothetical protein